MRSTILSSYLSKSFRQKKNFENRTVSSWDNLYAKIERKTPKWNRDNPRLIEKIRFTGICIFFVSWHQQLVNRKRSYEKRILQDPQVYLFCNNVHSSVQTFSLSKNSAKLSQKIPLKYVDLSIVLNLTTFTHLCNQNGWDCQLLSAKLNFSKCRLISATRFFLRIYVNVTKFIPKVDKCFQKSHSIRAFDWFTYNSLFWSQRAED